MPELPEMQALSERLSATFAGLSLTGLDLKQFSALKTVEPSPDQLLGRALEGVGRRGKYLLFRFGSVRLVLHLSQGGRVDVEDPPKTTKPKGSVARLRFEDGPSLLIKEFGTERKAALWVLDEDDRGPFENLGPEPTSNAFEELIREGTDGRRLHTMLRDQRTVAGIGRGFSDDILHAAMISPFDSLKSLTKEQRGLLLDATSEVLAHATDKERERTGGLPVKLKGRFTVHGRFGEPCPRCYNELRRVSYESHEIVYCPLCQTGGKVLADRRLSRLIR